jgi:putative ABC transport system permease protein
VTRAATLGAADGTARPEGPAGGAVAAGDSGTLLADWFAHEEPSGTTDTRAIVGIAWRSIRGNASRSLLTALGVIIGVAAVVALTAVGAGVTQNVTANLERLGTNLLTIGATVTRSSTGIVRSESSGITVGDAELLRSLQWVDGRILGVAPSVTSNLQVRAGGLNTTAQVLGTWPDYAPIRDLEVGAGAWWTDVDVESRARVAVLGHEIAQELFPGMDPLGQSLNVGTHTFTVVGVLPDKGAGFGSPNRQIIVPLSTYLQRLARSQVAGGTSAQSVNQIFVRATEAQHLTALQSDVTRLLADERGEFDLEALSFQVQNQADTLESLTAVSRTLTLFLGAIAGISLLVGGIGIMNIMLVSVTERTREIGIRKALGARPADIRLQFLVEAVVLAAGGGLLGLALGAAGAHFVSPLLGVTSALTVPPMAVAFGVALFVGVVFGLYPAQRAARLDPVASLRHE